MKVADTGFIARPSSMLWASRQWLALFKQALVEFVPACALALGLIAVATEIRGDPQSMIAAIAAVLMVPFVTATHRYVVWRRWSRR